MRREYGIKTKRHQVLALFESVPDPVPRPTEWVKCEYDSSVTLPEGWNRGFPVSRLSRAIFS